MIKCNSIYKINKNKKNMDVVNNYLINGSKNIVYLQLEEDNSDNILQKEKIYGIVTYNENFIYGNKNAVPENFNKIEEPIRILINKSLYDNYVNHIKKLIVINTENNNYINMTFEELLQDFKYDIIYKIYDNSDLQNRFLPLPGKFNDAKTIYQNIEKNNSLILNLTIVEKKLYEWYSEYINILKSIKLDIINTINKIFNTNDEFYFQKNNPLRFSINNSIGTPLHVDTCSKMFDPCNNDIKKCEKIKISNNTKYYETFQDENILNINYMINDTVLNSNNLKICTIKYDEIGKKEGHFLNLLLNYPNECFIFNASKYLHYKSYNFMNCYIRGDMRIINKKDYNYNKFKLYRGPRMNFEVSFCRYIDLNKLNDSNVKYGVFE